MSEQTFTNEATIMYAATAATAILAIIIHTMSIWF